MDSKISPGSGKEVSARQSSCEPGQNAMIQKIYSSDSHNTVHIVASGHQVKQVPKMASVAKTEGRWFPLEGLSKVDKVPCCVSATSSIVPS